MALRPIGLTQAAQSAVNSYLMKRQMDQEQAATEQNDLIKSLMGTALTGGATPEQMTQLATAAPEKFLGVQNYLTGQQQAKQDALAAEEEARNNILNQQRAEFLDWEEDLFERVKAASPEDRETVYNQLMGRGQSVFDQSFFQNMPAQYDQSVAQFIDSMGDTTAVDLKSGRFKETVAPNGDVYLLDSATGERNFLYEGVAPVVELNAGMENRLVNTQDNARKAASKAREYESIASDFENFDVSAGGFSTGWEALKDLTGQQDYESELRRKWRGVKSSQVVDNLPPGAASDKDIEMAMGGFPPDNASPEVIASFMRGLAKIEKENSRYNELEAQWIATQGNTAQAKSDFAFNGMAIEEGDTLLESYKKMASDIYPENVKSEINGSAQTFTSPSGTTIQFTVE